MLILSFFTSLTSNCSESETDLYRRKEARRRNMDMNYNMFSEKKNVQSSFVLLKKEKHGW